MATTAPVAAAAPAVPRSRWGQVNPGRVGQKHNLRLTQASTHIVPLRHSRRTLGSKVKSTPLFRGAQLLSSRAQFVERKTARSAVCSSLDASKEDAGGVAAPEIEKPGQSSQEDLLRFLEPPNFTDSYPFDAPEDSSNLQEASEFRWDHNWYAVHAIEQIDPAVLHAVTVLGRPIVLWRDASETWRAFLDECPHRRVPLSEGRIDEKGCLACSYHAWSFNGNGGCACIPQASEGPESRAINNPRSRCTVFPLRVENGVIFVWPDETKPDLAAKKLTALPPGVDDPSVVFKNHMRDLPYSWEFAAENLIDPAHVPVAHHGITGINRNQAKPIKLQIKSSDKFGFQGMSPPSYEEFYKATLNDRHSFQFPTIFAQDRIVEKDGQESKRNILALYMTPTTPGNCRVVVVNGLPASFSSIPFVRAFNALGLSHFPLMDLLDSDAVFLHYQEVSMRASAERSGLPWREKYYVPTRSDLYVIEFHKWLNRFGHGGVKYGPGWDIQRAPGGTREQLMDRYNGHVAQCTVCTEALANYRKARLIFASLGIASILLLGGVLGSVAAAGNFAAVSKVAGIATLLLLLVAVCGGGLMFCNTIIQKFIYSGWDHGRNP